MRRSMPLLASILFLLLLNLVHSLAIPTHGPILNGRGFYSNRNDSLADNNSITHPTPTKTTSNSSPVVETIYIIESDGHTYHELGGGSYRTPTASSTVNDPNASNIENEVNQDTAVLHRLITITTVVGGVGIGLLVTGTLIYMRLRAKRKRMKAEMNLYHNNSSFASYLSNIAGVNKRKRARRQHQYGHHSDNDDNNSNTNNDDNNDDNSNDHQNNGSNSHHHHHQITINTTGPSESSSNLPMNPAFQESIEMNIIPSAPPDPVLLDEQVRSRRQISMISQQQAFAEPISSSPSSVIPLPSAPSAKELMMNQPSLPSSSSSKTTTATTTTTTTTPLPPLQSSSSRLYHRRNISSSSSSTSPSNSHQTSLLETDSSTLFHSQRQQQQQQQHEFLKPTTIHENELHSHSPVTPDIPPPAYTPSAPPLFVLPPSHRRRSADEISLDRYRH